ncbi:peroxisome biogenesis protein 3-1-like [Selaginella moellendorffii]|uniref:peroxisome biogenesis protein 3-1-like n=1 Tax=Selaginella moellendorffii TaxID=88036 RepID=UPI000D1C5F58|nr:peroxisome biogenesis protein 3-1-like [Selaginella moellendorffii]|eukprot:XP_024527426.1 peroxisome biogenesis protein 3-1-like [Selaginella moellendorffii]
MTTPLHMACYGDLRAWFRRRRRAILIAAGALGAGCVLYYGFTRYSAAALARARAVEEEESRLRAEKEEERILHLRRHCDEIQLLADATTLPSLLAHLSERLFELVNLSELTRQLMAGKEGPQALTPDEKLNLWQKLKVSSFTRTLCAAWGMGLVQLFVRVQLNLLGRQLFISTASFGDLPFSTQHKFLAFGDFLPLHGIALLVQDVEEAVTEVMRDISLKKTYSFDELRDLLIQIQAAFEKQQNDWCRYLLPENDKLPQEDYPVAESSHSRDDDEQLLVAKARDVISSAEFQHTLGAVLDALLDTMVQDLLPYYQGQPAVGLPLAKLVPAVSSVGMLLDNRQDSKYVRAVAELPEVKSFSAMVYGSAA